MNFKEVFKEKINKTEQVIESYLPKEEGEQKTVLQAMNYSVRAGGKRLRPLLILEVYTLFGGKEKIIEPFMAAIEMIHTYSLVHDDLPAMDNDDYRRGKETTHKAFGEAMGILAGDGLLNYAFETAIKAFSMTDDVTYVADALSVLAHKAGIYGMIGGQTADIELTGKEISSEQLNFIYRLKTGALIESAMMIGAVLAGASKEEVKKIEEAAAKIGMAFQIQDDILDVTSTTEVLGKPVHSDEKNEKMTYVVLKGMDEAKEKVKILSGEATDIIQNIGTGNEFLTELIHFLMDREK